jgi:hypothetical protein
MDNIVEFKEVLKDRVEKNLDDLFKLLKETIRVSSDFRNELRMLAARYEDFEKNRRMGVLGDEAADKLMNKLRLDILSFIDKLKEEDYNDSLASKKSFEKQGLDKEGFEKKLKTFGRKKRLKSREGLGVY